LFGTGGRLPTQALALAASCALAALAVPNPSIAQVPTFNTVVMTPTGSQPWQPPRPAAVGDYNGDGKLDALIADGSESLRFLQGYGNGTFFRGDVGATWLTSTNVVDLPANLAPYLAPGTGGTSIGGFVLIARADVNGDGKPDAICVRTVHINWGPQSLVTVFTNTGTTIGGWLPEFTQTNYLLGFYDVRSLTAGDLNGDGKPDFIVGSAYAGLYVYLNNGNGTFTRTQVTNIIPSAGGPAVGPGVIADLNGDGKGDFVVTSGQANSTNVFLGNGDGTLQAPTNISVAATAVAVADLNSDGKPDLLRGYVDGSVTVALGNGNGTFGSPASFSTVAGGYVYGFFVSDANGDGKLDVAANLAYAAKVAILTGNGDGTLGAAALYGTIPAPMDVTLADFTGDGKPDIASVSANGYGGQNFAVMTNTTVFAPPLPIQTLTILGGSGTAGGVAGNVEYYNPATGNWQQAFLAQFYNQWGQPVSGHPWGNVPGTNQWINYRTDGRSDAGVNGSNPGVYLYRVRFTVPTDAIEPRMTFSLKADNYAQVAINGVSAGGLITGSADQLNVDAVFSQSVLPGQNTITLTITDTGGLNGFNFRIDLSMRSSQPLEIVVPPPSDTTPPVITAPANITREAAGPSGTVVTFTATAVDNTDGAVAVVASPASGSTFPLGTTPVGLAASDRAGNTASASFTVTVRDTIAPVVSVPSNITAEATSAAGAAVGYPAPTATDAVGVTSISSSPASGSTFALGTTTVNVSARDAANNIGTGSFTVTVRDTTAPALTVPASQTLEATSAAGAVATFAASATDAVGVTSLTYSAASGSTFPIGTTTVTVTARDAAGNASSGSFTITVRDTTAPVFSSLTPSSATLWPPNHQMVAIRLTAVATDIVGVVSTRIVSVTSNEPDNGLGDGDTAGDIQVTGDLTLNLRAERAGNGNGRVYTITVEARDAAGNATRRTTTVSVPKSQGRG
jgi:hypothetical protein